jgi:hypothetical protein
MTATARTLIGHIALPVLSAGIICGAALGLAGTALGLAGTAAANTGSTHPAPRPGIVATPNHIAPPVTRFPSKRTERLELQWRNYGH